MKAQFSGADIRVVGHPFVSTGVADHLRASMRALRAAGLAPTLCDIYEIGRGDDPALLEEFKGALRPGLSRDINLFHINGDEVAQALAHLRDPRFAEAYNIILPAWELPRYPAPWAEALNQFDEVWASSEFIAGSLSTVVSKPLRLMPQAVAPALTQHLGRRALGIPDHVTAFLFFFDLSSYIARKNPFQVIEAFKALVARHPREPAHLILKFKGSLTQDTTGAQLRDAIGAVTDRVQLIEGALPDHSVKNLVRNADCFISLHRSEGFGRGLAEAMAFGVPVIATGYSGNLTFMRPENSRLVACRQIAVGPGEYPHWEDQSWAQPELEDAVAAMEDILLNRAQVLEKARQAKLDMAMNFSSLAMGTRYAERLREVMAPA